MENSITLNQGPEPDMTSLSPANAEQLRQAFQRCRDMEGPLSERLRSLCRSGT